MERASFVASESMTRVSNKETEVRAGRHASEEGKQLGAMHACQQGDMCVSQEDKRQGGVRVIRKMSRDACD